MITLPVSSFFFCVWWGFCVKSYSFVFGFYRLFFRRNSFCLCQNLILFISDYSVGNISKFLFFAHNCSLAFVFFGLNMDYINTKISLHFIEDNIDVDQGRPSVQSLLQEDQESALWNPSWVSLFLSSIFFFSVQMIEWTSLCFFLCG